MKVCVIGAGYVGLVTAAGLAEMGNEVSCVDCDLARIERLRQGEIPIYEPGLEELVLTNVQEGRLEFLSDLPQAVKRSSICIIAVGTPQAEDGHADLTSVLAVARDIAAAMNDYKVVATKSTVPVGTADHIAKTMKEITSHDFSLVSNPEFLKQGSAVEDFLRPDRVVVGTHRGDDRAAAIMRELYAPFLRTGNPVIFMDVRSAEMTKYAANAFLATKISFMNEIANLCERVGADVAQVRIGMASDSRIGPQFLFAGIGFGGSCFPKDVKALEHTGADVGYPMQIVRAIGAVNLGQRSLFVDKVRSFFNDSLQGKRIGIWGLAFKPRTDDMREAPSITVIEGLLAAGATINAFDPKAMSRAKEIFGDRISYAANRYDALNEADALCILTEWNEFRRPDFDRIREMLKAPVIFDARNQFEPERMAARGFHYFSIGKAKQAPLEKPTPLAVRVK